MSVRKVDILETLHGLVCLYKPPDVGVTYLMSSFARKLCSDLNSSDVQPPISYLDIQSKCDKVSVNIRPSYLDNRLASGPKYQSENVVLFPAPIGRITSGVCVLGIQNGIKYIHELKKYTPVKVLHVKGMLGEATRFFYKGEKVMAKATYKKLRKTTMDAVLSSVQAAHQRKIFSEFGVSIQSQAAYDLAVGGMLKPLKGDVPAIYSIKCIDFQPPEFTLEIVCIQETENYLLKFIHDLGLELRTFAHCTGMRCIRYGPFTVNKTLLLKECTMENIRKNIKLCRHLMIHCRENKSPHLKPVIENIASNQYSSDIGK